jgi:hypothetical protein
MPNWCENDLTVEGPKEAIDAFMAFAEGESPFDFERFVPHPEAYRTGDLDDYDWCIENWGTKWTASYVSRGEPEPGLTHGTVMVFYNLNTAWSPPLPVIQKASELFPLLSFELRYFESGCCFNGMFCCSGGAVTLDDSGPYFGDRGG